MAMMTVMPLKYDRQQVETFRNLCWSYIRKCNARTIPGMITGPRANVCACRSWGTDAVSRNYYLLQLRESVPGIDLQH